MLKIHCVFALLFCVLLHSQVNKEIYNSYNKTIWQDFTYDMGNVFKGVGHAYSRPLYWKKNDFLKFGGVLVTTFSLYLSDNLIRTEFQSQKENVPDFLLDYGWYAGSPQNNYGFTGALYLTGLFTRNEKLRRTGVLLISASTATGFLQQLTKSAAGRARPDTEFGKNHFRPFGGSSMYRSFPSGHSVLTFTNAHVIAKQFKSWWIKAPIYTIGLIPGLSRIYEDKHWASDVFLSWALSYFVVESIDLYLNSKYKKKYNGHIDNKLSLDFIFTGNTITLCLNL